MTRRGGLSLGREAAVRESPASMRHHACLPLGIAALLTVQSCARPRSNPSGSAGDAATEASTVSAPASSVLPTTVSVQGLGNGFRDAGAVDAAAPRDECRCTAPSAPKQVALSAPGTLFGGPSAGLGYVLVTDDENLYYSAVALYAPEGEYCSTALVSRSIATGLERKLFDVPDDILWCSRGARVSGGRFYFNITEKESSYTVRDLHSVPVSGGPITPHPSWWAYGASGTHVYWLGAAAGGHDRAIFRRPLSGGPAVVIRQNVDYKSGVRFIESSGTVYWAEKMRKAATGDSGVPAPAGAGSDARLVRLGADDPAGPREDAKVVPGAGDYLATASIHGDSIYWWNGACVVAAKLDGSEGQCVVNLKPYSNLVIKDDYGYWNATPSTVTRASLRDSASGPETVVRCDGAVRDFVVARETLFFTCLETIWSVATSRAPATSPSSAIDASSDSPASHASVAGSSKASSPPP